MISLVENVNIVKLDGSLEPRKNDQDQGLNHFLVKEIVCFNQGELAQFSYLASLKHKKLKQCFEADPDDLTSLKSAKEELEAFLNEEFEKVSYKNFDYILKYFSGRKPIEPRVCLKCHDEGDSITDLFRDRSPQKKPGTYSGIKYLVEENSGFSIVYDTGLAYICKNIPAAVRAGNYKNPRLDSNRVIRYKDNTLKRYFYQTTCKADQAWIDCWKDIEKESTREKVRPLPEECYKSTMIIPLTLLNNTLQKEFKDLFQITKDSNKVIYGYLCLDHQASDYFIKEDSAIGYVIADLLSLYMIFNLMYTDYSKTYQQVSEKLRKGETKLCLT